MKIGIYQEIKKDQSLENIEILNAIKRRNDIEESIIVDPTKIKIQIINNKLNITFGDRPFDKSQLDILLIRGGFGNIPSLIEVIKECRKNGIKVFDNNFSEIRYLINKRADSIKLVNNGIPMPNTYIFFNIEDLENSNLEFPLVMKTSNTGKGLNVLKVNNIKEVKDLLITKNTEIRNYLFQEIIDYEHDLRVLVCGDEVIGCMKRIPPVGDFRANYSLGGSVESFIASNEIKELSLKAAKAANLQISGVDVLVEKNTGKLYILETNHTPGLEGISSSVGKIVSDKVVEYMIKNAN